MMELHATQHTMRYGYSSFPARLLLKHEDIERLSHSPDFKTPNFL